MKNQGTSPDIIRLSPIALTQTREAFVNLGHAHGIGLSPKTSHFQQGTQNHPPKRPSQAPPSAAASVLAAPRHVGGSLPRTRLARHAEGSSHGHATPAAPHPRPSPTRLRASCSSPSWPTLRHGSNSSCRRLAAADSPRHRRLPALPRHAGHTSSWIHLILPWIW